MERSGYSHGEPCWADVLTPDVGSSQRFYGAVFGWSFVSTGPEFGNYSRRRIESEFDERTVVAKFLDELTRRGVLA